MPGYRLIHDIMLKSYRADGIDPHPNRIGFLDYLRELRQDPFPFSPGYKIRVEGLEDVLLAAGDHLDEVEHWIYTLLASKANELNSTLGTDVQIILRSKPQRFDDFWIEAGLKKHLSLQRIFGTPVRREGPNGTEYFSVGFNLT